jgi:cytoskeletal protein CcmA (bactofilin family)
MITDYRQKILKSLAFVFLLLMLIAISSAGIFGAFQQNVPASGNQFTTAANFPFDPGNVPSDPVEAQEYYYSYNRLGLESIVGSQSITVQNGATVTGNIGTNGTVTTTGGTTVCGPLRNGTGNPNQTPNCPEQSAAQGQISLPDVVLPSDIATNNSNSRLSGADPVPNNVWQRGNITWNPTTRSLRVNYSSLTLLGTAPYFLCRLEVSGVLNINTVAPASIFLDSPENCPGVGTDQLVVNQGGQINHNDAIPGFYLKGSATTNTSINLSGGIQVNGAVIYAPRSNATISSGYYYNGAIVAKSLLVSGGGTVTNTLNLNNYLLPIN